MVIVNDRTPIHGHDPALVARQLRGVVERYGCGCVLLDFQRPGAEAVAAAVVEALSCPVGVPPAYGKGLDCPVFLPPVPLRTPVAQYLAPWKGRELWLEAALDGEEVTVTPQGTACRPLDHPAPTDTPLYDEALFCHYRIDAEADSLRFHLRRTQEDLDALLYSAEPHGVTRTIGLWQEFRQCL